jgi:hypothetical protein
MYAPHLSEREAPAVCQPLVAVRVVTIGRRMCSVGATHDCEGLAAYRHRLKTTVTHILDEIAPV